MFKFLKDKIKGAISRISRKVDEEAEEIKPQAVPEHEEEIRIQAKEEISAETEEPIQEEAKPSEDSQDIIEELEAEEPQQEKISEEQPAGEEPSISEELGDISETESEKEQPKAEEDISADWDIEQEPSKAQEAEEPGPEIIIDEEPSEKEGPEPEKEPEAEEESEKAVIEELEDHGEEPGMKEEGGAGSYKVEIKKEEAKKEEVSPELDSEILGKEEKKSWAERLFWKKKGGEQKKEAKPAEIGKEENALEKSKEKEIAPESAEKDEISESAAKRHIEEKAEKREIKQKTAETEKKGPDEEKKGFFGKLAESIATKKLNEEKFDGIFSELEMALLESNVAFEVIEKIKSDLKRNLVEKPIRRNRVEETIVESLRNSIESLFEENRIDIASLVKKKAEKPFIIAFFGINGAGKTTSIAKIASMLKSSGLKVVLAASDTFRAASIEQLQMHADNVGVKIIKHDYNSDPAAVAFDAIKFAKSKGMDCVLIDTAGRMHSNANLMEELRKIVRVSKPDLKIFVGESITGNDCVEQAQTFNEAVDFDGIILSKADIDEKGGAAVSVSYITKKPIIYFGVGQEYKDLRKFDTSIVMENLGLA